MERHDALVGAQLLAVAALGWPGPPRWRLPPWTCRGAEACALAGAGLAAAGLWRHGTRLTPRVEPPQDAVLLTDGPYALSRHPVYAGLLVGAAGVAVRRRRPEPLVALAALSAVLHVKSGVEESRLRRRFGAAYEQYAARTPRLLGLPGRR